jgi:hypothetical protein
MQKLLIVFSTALALLASPALAQPYEDVRVGDVAGFGWVCKDKLGAELILAAVQYESANSDPRVINEVRKHCAPIQVQGNVTGVFESAIDFEGDKVTIVSTEDPAGTTYWSVVFPAHTILHRDPTA